MNYFIETVLLAFCFVVATNAAINREPVKKAELSDEDNLYYVIMICATLAVVILIICVILALVLLYLYFLRRIDRLCPRISSNTSYSANTYRKLLCNCENETKSLSKETPENDKKESNVLKNISNDTETVDQQEPTIKSESKDWNFQVPQKSVRKNIQFRPRSKSEWNISELNDTSTENFAKVILRNRENGALSAASRVESFYKSQYFDALEELDKEAEDDEYEDIGDVEVVSTYLKQSTPVTAEQLLQDPKALKILSKKFGAYIPSNFQNSLNTHVKKRIKALKNIQVATLKLDAEFYKDVFQLETHYHEVYRKKLFERRKQIINSIYEQLAAGGEKWLKKCPRFWLVVLKNVKIVSEIIRLEDEPVLKYLEDVTFSIKSGKQMVFTLQFYFVHNPYFSNRVLQKEYHMKCKPYSDDPFSFEGPEIYNCKGCKIEWFPHKNITKLVGAKNPNRHHEKSDLRKESFFNFFDPPPIPGPEVEMDKYSLSILARDFAVGQCFRETIIPKALFLFMKSFKIPTDFFDSNEAAKKSEKTRVELTKNEVLTNENVDSQHHEKQVDFINDLNQTNLISSHLGIKESCNIVNNEDVENLNENHLVTEETNLLIDNNNISKVTVVNNENNITEKDSDPFIGTFIMESSEGFDEFMKALGVGLMKRKLANSMTPTQIISKNEDEEYTILTQTSLKSTEIVFRIGKPFTETTMDGRVVTTTVEKEGTSLLQIQDSGTASKNCVLTRHFEGDIMTMKLSMDKKEYSVRIYKRVIV